MADHVAFACFIADELEAIEMPLLLYETVLILAGIFDLVLVFILRRKCLIVLVTFESFIFLV